VLAAAAELERRRRTDIKIVLVGDGKLKPQLRRRAADARLSNMLFLDPIPKLRLAGLMAATDVGLQILANVPAFYYGTSPNKFFDYIASGVPVLINYPGWLAELVAETRCGYPVSPADPNAFADALTHAADHRQALTRMRERARQLAVAKFGRHELGIAFVNWLESAVSG
jgi:glycosyltransferase involved in cell wall biosynthesis